MSHNLLNRPFNPRHSDTTRIDLGFSAEGAEVENPRAWAIPAC